MVIPQYRSINHSRVMVLFFSVNTIFETVCITKNTEINIFRSDQKSFFNKYTHK